MRRFFPQSPTLFLSFLAFVFQSQSFTWAFDYLHHHLQAKLSYVSSKRRQKLKRKLKERHISQVSFFLPPSTWYAERGCHRNNETISRCGNWGFCTEAFFAFNDALTNNQKSQRSYLFDPSWRLLLTKRDCSLLACLANSNNCNL